MAVNSVAFDFAQDKLGKMRLLYPEGPVTTARQCDGERITLYIPAAGRGGGARGRSLGYDILVMGVELEYSKILGIESFGNITSLWPLMNSF